MFDPENLAAIFRAVESLTGNRRCTLLSIELDDSDSFMNVHAFLNGARSNLPPNTIGNVWYRVTAYVDELDSPDIDDAFVLLGDLGSPQDPRALQVQVGGIAGQLFQHELVEIQAVMEAVHWWAEYGVMNPHMNWWR
jgi:hypothetical protein